METQLGKLDLDSHLALTLHQGRGSFRNTNSRKEKVRIHQDMRDKKDCPPSCMDETLIGNGLLRHVWQSKVIEGCLDSHAGVTVQKD